MYGSDGWVRPVQAGPPLFAKGGNGKGEYSKGFSGKGVTQGKGSWEVGKGGGGRGFPQATSSPTPVVSATYAEVVKAPVIASGKGNSESKGKDVAVSSQAVSSSSGSGGWTVVQGKGGKGKGGGGQSICFACHLQGRDWHHPWRGCEYSKRFEEWKASQGFGVS